MSTLVDSLVAAGWTAEDFDGDPSATIDSEHVNSRVVTDEDGDTILLLGDLETENIQFWIIDGEGKAETILPAQAPSLTPLGVSGMVHALVESGHNLQGGSGVDVDPNQLDALERLPFFRGQFWQVVPYEGAALARFEGDGVGVEIMENLEENLWEMIITQDDDDDTEGYEDVYRMPVSDQAAQIIADLAPSFTAEQRTMIPDALSAAGINLEVAVFSDEDEDEDQS